MTRRALLLAVGLAFGQSGWAQDTALYVSGNATLTSVEQRQLSGELGDRGLIAHVVLPVSTSFVFVPESDFVLRADHVGAWTTPAPLASLLDTFFATVDPGFSLALFQPDAYSARSAQMIRTIGVELVLDDLELNVFSDWYGGMDGYAFHVSWSYLIRHSRLYSDAGGATLPTSPLTVADVAAFINADLVPFSAGATVERCAEVCDVAYIDYGGFAALTAATAPAIPEPESAVLLLAGLGLLGFAARRGIRRRSCPAPRA
jgi:hypothetical protein